MTNPKTRGNYPVRICVRKTRCPYADQCDECFKYSLWKKAIAEGKVTE